MKTTHVAVASIPDAGVPAGSDVEPRHAEVPRKPCRYPVGKGSERRMCGDVPAGWCSTCSETPCRLHSKAHGIGFNEFIQEKTA